MHLNSAANTIVPCTSNVLLHHWIDPYTCNRLDDHAFFPHVTYSLTQKQIKHWILRKDNYKYQRQISFTTNNQSVQTDSQVVHIFVWIWFQTVICVCPEGLHTLAPARTGQIFNCTISRRSMVPCQLWSPTQGSVKRFHHVHVCYLQKCLSFIDYLSFSLENKSMRGALQQTSLTHLVASLCLVNGIH